MLSHKNLLISSLKQNVSKHLITMKNILSLLLFFTVSFALGQEKDKALQKSNDYVYEGNSLIDEDFIAAEKEYR